MNTVPPAAGPVSGPAGHVGGATIEISGLRKQFGAVREGHSWRT